MFRSTSLDPSHYAANWREDQQNDPAAVNRLGLSYAKSHDSSKKEEKLLQILEMFHGYTMKYLSMILKGTLPWNTTSIRDTRLMLQPLIPRGAEVNTTTLKNACKMLHLAFKMMPTEEIYDTLALCLLRAARKYDPHHADKMKSVCEAINELPTEFTKARLNKRMSMDCSVFLRGLVRKGFLASIAGPTKRIMAYRKVSWPPEQQFFESGPIGFVYVLLIWFRWYLREFIVGRMSEIEALEDVLQLEHQTPNFGRMGDLVMGDHANIRETGLPHSEGNCVTSQVGEYRYMADIALMNLSLDISPMDLDWVQGTNDKLFRNLSRRERLILYLVFSEEKNWKELARALRCDQKTAKRRFCEVLQYLIARNAHVEFVEAWKQAEQIVKDITAQRAKKKPLKILIAA